MMFVLHDVHGLSTTKLHDAWLLGGEFQIATAQARKRLRETAKRGASLHSAPVRGLQRPAPSLWARQQIPRKAAAVYLLLRVRWKNHGHIMLRAARPCFVM